MSFLYYIGSVRESFEKECSDLDRCWSKPWMQEHERTSHPSLTSPGWLKASLGVSQLLPLAEKKHLIFVVPRMLARGAQQNLAAAFSLSTSNSGAQRTCRWNASRKPWVPWEVRIFFLPVPFWEGVVAPGDIFPRVVFFSKLGEMMEKNRST